ncbi:hypothetical protein ACR6A7_16155 [Pantoea sp. RRHST58]|uniref:hypothetical protein n=1 Tax=Pantoea sp. RRHST58 TaxID=3425183 RepID=UPI003DA10FEA
MHNESQQQKTTLLVIPLNVVIGIIIGLVVILSLYIFSNDVVAAPLQQAPDAVTPAQSLPGQQTLQARDSYAHVIVYRDSATLFTPDRVLNIFINNQYHTSILPYTRAVELVLCPGKKEVIISLSQHDHHRFSQLSKTDEMLPTLRAGKGYYFEVSLNKQGKITARQVPEKEAKSVLAGLKPQTRILTRVTNEYACPETMYTFSSNAFFARHSNSLLGAESHRALKMLFKNFHREFEEIDSEILKLIDM